MRKVLAASVCTVLALVLVPEASAERARTDQRRYNYFEVGAGRVGGRIGNAVDFDTYAEERSLRVVIEDQSGLIVNGDIRQDVDGDGTYELISHFCGATKRAVRITAGFPVRVGLREGPCRDGGAPLGISGVVKATFTR